MTTAMLLLFIMWGMLLKFRVARKTTADRQKAYTTAKTESVMKSARDLSGGSLGGGEGCGLGGGLSPLAMAIRILAKREESAADVTGSSGGLSALVYSIFPN